MSLHSNRQQYKHDLPAVMDSRQWPVAVNVSVCRMKLSFLMTAAAQHVVSEVTSAQGILAMWSCHCPSIIPWSSREDLAFPTFMHACISALVPCKKQSRVTSIVYCHWRTYIFIQM